MRLCLISRYPPIQGGIAARTYWLAQGLAQRDVEVHIVTNANAVEKEYRIQDPSSEPPSNVRVHFIDAELPWHIPYSELYVPRLLDKGLQVIREHRIDLMDTGFLIPYGIVGYLLSEITGVPYVLRHGGSDLSKFLRQGIFGDLLEKTIGKAAAIVTDDHHKEFFNKLNRTLHVVPRYIPDERAFRPVFLPHDKPTFAYIGKINYHWRRKGLHRIVEIFSGLEGDCRLILVGQGRGFEDFSEFAAAYGLVQCEFRPFVHPANVPRLLSEVDFLICLAEDDPIQDFSNIFCEALWSGVKVLADDAADLSSYSPYLEFDEADQIVKLPTADNGAARGKVMELVKGWQGPQRCANRLLFDFNGYLDANLGVYNKTLR